MTHLDDAIAKIDWKVATFSITIIPMDAEFQVLFRKLQSPNSGNTTGPGAHPGLSQGTQGLVYHAACSLVEQEAVLKATAVRSPLPVISAGNVINSSLSSLSSTSHAGGVQP